MSVAGVSGSRRVRNAGAGRQSAGAAQVLETRKAAQRRLALSLQRARRVEEEADARNEPYVHQPELDGVEEMSVDFVNAAG